MSHTNSTPNYNLPQFVGTDKPTWLNDVNGAFTSIDTQMKANADSATTANTQATTAVTNTGSLTNLQTTDKTSLVNAVNEVNTNVGTASGIANQAVGLANQAQTDANSANTLAQALASFVNINNYTTYNTTSQFTRLAGTGNCQSANVTVATNADKSLAKIYGSIYITSTGSGDTKWKLNVDTGLRPTSPINVKGIMYLSPVAGTLVGNTGTVTINTDGTIEFSSYNNGSSSVEFDLWACVLWIKDFGDTPEETV